MTARDTILSLLNEHGPMTSPEVSALLGLAEATARNTLCQMNKKSPKFPRQVYIKDWVRDPLEGQRAYLRPVWDIGNKQNKPKPPALTGAERQVRLRERKTGLVNSVFALASVTGRRGKKTRVSDLISD